VASIEPSVGVTVSFACSTGRTYTLQCITDPAGPAWSAVPGQSNTIGEADGAMALTAGAPPPGCAYRVDVSLP
jgi:hypothetical protein